MQPHGQVTDNNSSSNDSRFSTESYVMNYNEILNVQVNQSTVMTHNSDAHAASEQTTMNCDSESPSNSNISDLNNITWQTVINKRKADSQNSLNDNLLTKRSHRDPRLQKSQTSPNIFTYNRFDHLPQEEVNTNTAESAREIRPPPIYLTSDIQYVKLCELLSNIVGSNNYVCVSTTKGVRINPSTSDSYRKIVAYFRANNAQFHTFQLSEDKAFRIVIRGLHPSIETSEIKNELSELGFCVKSVTNVLSRDKTPLPLYFVDLDRSNKSEEIFKLDVLLHSKIKVEEPRKKRTIVQCHRCQNYGHTKSYCTRPSKCVRCAGNHDYRVCTKPKSTPAKCALCNFDHPSNYKGCSVYKSLQNRQAVGKTARLPTPAPSNSSPSIPSSSHPANILDTKSYPPLRNVQQTLDTPQHSKSYAHATKYSEHPSFDISSLSQQMSSFITEMKNLITPIITLLSQFMQTMMAQSNGK